METSLYITPVRNHMNLKSRGSFSEPSQKVIEICQPIRLVELRKPVANQNASLHVRLQGREKKNPNKPRRRKFSKNERADN